MENNFNNDYFMWPFYKKMWYNIKKYFKGKKENFKINYTLLIIIALVILLFGVLVAIILTNKIDTSIHPRHDKMQTMQKITDRCQIDDSGNFTCENDENNEVIFTNSNFEFRFDLTTTNFKLTNLNDNSVYTSVPMVDGKYLNFDTLVLAYYDDLGNAYTQGNRANSIDTQSYYLSVDQENNKLEVFYDFNNKGISDTDFPRALSIEKYDMLYLLADLANKNGYESKYFKNVFKSVFNINNTYKDLGYYPRLTSQKGNLSGSTATTTSVYRLFYEYYNELLIEYAKGDSFKTYLKTKYKTITETQIETITSFLETEYPNKSFVKDGYSEDVLLKDKEVYDEVFKDDKEFVGITAYRTERTFIGASIVYELTNDGIKATIPNDSIQETSSKPLVYLELLPYFGANSKENEGYTMIPDGSGILIEHNNNKSSNTYGPVRIYGSDAVNKSDYLKEETYDISYPLFGVYSKNADNTENGFISIVENGAEMCYITASNSLKNSSNNALKEYYNYANFRFYLREGTSYVFPDWQNPLTVTARTKTYIKDDLTISYNILTEDKSYSGMALEYRNYLIESKKIKDNDSTDEVTLNLTLIGGYKTEKSILGIPYKYVDSLTSTNEVKLIVDELKNDNVNNLNLIYTGWSNNGVKSTTYRDIYFNSNVGSKKDIQKLNNYINNIDGYNFYPLVNLQTNYTDKGFSPSKEAIRNSQTGVIEFYDFNQATTLKDETTTVYYYLKPSKITEQVSSFAKKYNKLKLDNLAISDLGNNLNGTYNNTSTEFRSDALTAYYNSMETLINTLGSDTLLVSYSPSEYALKYSNLILDLPETGTNYVVVDRMIPFTQLLLSGVYDYSSESFNINDKEQFIYHKLKCIETGSNISFTWSYDETYKLINTEYNYYYSTYYKNSYDVAISMYNELKSLDLYKGKLVKHQQLIDNVVASTYLLNDNSYVTYIINYSSSSYTFNNSQVISPNEYIEIRGTI